MSNLIKLKGKPKIKEMVMQAEVPDSYVSAYVDSSGLGVCDEQGNKTIIIQSSKYKSPSWAFDQFCRALDLKRISLSKGNKS